MGKFLISLLVLLILAAGASFYGSGYYAKREFMKHIEMTQAMLDAQHSNVTLSVVKYEEGFLSSFADVVLKEKDADMASGNPPHLDILFRMLIKHGPVLQVDDKFVIGLAYIKGLLVLPDDIKSTLPPGVNFIFTTQTFVPFNATSLTTKFKIEPIAMGSMGSEIKWEGLFGVEVVDFKNHKITDAKYDVKIGRFAGYEPMMGLGFTMDPITILMSYAITDDNNKSSTGTIKFGSLNVNMQNNLLANLKSINIDGNTNVVNGNLTSQFEFQLNNLDTPMSKPITQINSIKETFVVSNLNNAAIIKFSDTADQMQEEMKGMNRSSQKMMSYTDNYKKLLDELIGVLNANSSVDTTTSIDTNQGKASLALNLSLSDKPKKQEDFATMGNVKVEFSISKQLVNVLLDYYIKAYGGFIPKSNPPAYDQEAVAIGMSQKADASKDQGKNIYFELVAELVKLKSISVEQSITLMAVADQHPATVADLDAMLAKNKLSPFLLEALSEAYQKQYLSTRAVPIDTMASQSPIQYNNPVTAAKAMIDDWVKQGIFVETGDSYSFSFIKSGKDMTLNGKADHPLLQMYKDEFDKMLKPSYAYIGDERSKTNQLMQTIQGITAAADALAQKDGAYNNSDVTQANIQALMPNNSLTTEWGATASISDQTDLSYVVTITNVPAAVCKLVTGRLKNNPEYEVISTCEGGNTVDFVYKYLISSRQ